MASRLRYLPDVLDFTLPQVTVSSLVSGRIQNGLARLIILPFRPQPSVCSITFANFGLDVASDDYLLHAARLAFSAGLISPPISPIQVGHAFQLCNAFVPEKSHVIGTGIVSKMGITRIRDLTAQHWTDSGYANEDEFQVYWHQAAPDLVDHANPWCWLIEFAFKG